MIISHYNNILQLCARTERIPCPVSRLAFLSNYRAKVMAVVKMPELYRRSVRMGRKERRRARGTLRLLLAFIVNTYREEWK